MLLIDCYNVLHTPMPPMLAGLDEAGLCRALARTAWTVGGVVVVADGRPKPLGVTESPVDAVELVYSGPSRTADAVIIERVNRHDAPRRVTVVSSDRQIRGAARKRRCTVWTSQQFITKLVEQLRAGGGSGGGSDKPSGQLSEQEVAHWLKAFEVEDQSSPPSSSGAGGSQKDAAPDEPRSLDDEFDIPGLWPPPGVEERGE